MHSQIPKKSILVNRMVRTVQDYKEKHQKKKEKEKELFPAKNTSACNFLA